MGSTIKIGDKFGNVFSSANFVWENNETTLKIVPTYGLYSDDRYLVSVKGVISTDGRTINDFEWSFDTSEGNWRGNIGLVSNAIYDSDFKNTVVANNGDNIMSAWVSRITSPSTQESLFVNISKNSSLSKDAEFLLKDVGANKIKDIKLVLTSNLAMVIWKEYNNAPHYNIYYRTCDISTKACNKEADWSTLGTITSDGSNIDFDLDYNSSGEVLMIAGYGSNVDGYFFNGSIWSSNNLGNSYTTPLTIEKIKLSDSGTGMAVWKDSSIFQGYVIYSKNVPTNWLSPQSLSHDNVNIDINNAGNIALIYSTDGGYKDHIKYFDYTGALKDTTPDISAYSNKISIAIDKENNIFAGLQPDATKITINKYNNTSSTFLSDAPPSTKDFALYDNSANYDLQSINLSSKDHKVALIWVEGYNTGGGNQYILGSYYGEDGLWKNSQLLYADSSDPYINKTQLFMDNNGNAFVVAYRSTSPQVLELKHLSDASSWNEYNTSIYYKNIIFTISLNENLKANFDPTNGRTILGWIDTTTSAHIPTINIYK